MLLSHSEKVYLAIVAFLDKAIEAYVRIFSEETRKNATSFDEDYKRFKIRYTDI